MNPWKFLMIDVRELKSRLNDWDAVLNDLAPELQDALQRKGRHGPCPVHGGHDGFRLFKDSSGGGYCATCGPFADGFALLQWLRGWTFPQALEAVAGWLGHAPVGVTARLLAPPVSDPTENPRRRQRLNALWRQAVPLASSRARPVRLYLENRGVPLEKYPAVLRCHLALACYGPERQPLGRYPALLALVADADGRPVTLHRTYLTPTGEKAPVPEVRKLFPYPGDRRLSGGAIRLFPPTAELHLAEGIETALAVHRATGGPVWSAVNAGLLERVEVPKAVQQVVIWGDLDRAGAGQSAAYALAGRLRREGRDVVLRLPGGPIPASQKSLDWLDRLVQQGPAALQRVA